MRKGNNIIVEKEPHAVAFSLNKNTHTQECAGARAHAPFARKSGTTTTISTIKKSTTNSAHTNLSDDDETYVFYFISKITHTYDLRVCVRSFVRSHARSLVRSFGLRFVKNL